MDIIVFAIVCIVVVVSYIQTQIVANIQTVKWYFYHYCNTNIRIINIKVDIRKIVQSTTTKKQNTIKIGIFKQFASALWQT